MRKEPGVKIADILFILVALIIGFSAAAMAISTARAQDVSDASAKLSQEQLEQILAPVALYPDDLLSQVLVASTYPLEVVEAERWLKLHQDLKGDALKEAARAQNWDESIQSLVATPDVLYSMSQKLDNTQKLGDAMLAQQDDVMAAVQNLRSRAYAQKTLQSNEQQTVEVQQQEGDNYIVIESTYPETVYVPYYNPTIVYGTWPYPYYPPVYYPAPIYYPVATGFMYGIGFAAGVAIWDDVWDSDCDWGHGDIDVDIDNDINIDRDDIINNRGDRVEHRQENRDARKEKWQHKPEHRRGVQYADNKTRQKFAPNTVSNRAQHQDFRGRMDNNGGNLSGQTQRPNLNQTANRLKSPPQPTSSARPQNNRATNFGNADRTGIRNRDSAFSDISSGKSAQRYGNRGSQSFNRSSRSSSSRASQSRSRSGGGSRGGGGGRRR